jgi:two-component system, NtrC family, response regulator AtoC
MNNTAPTFPVRILIAEDEPEIRDYLQLALQRPNFLIDFAENGEELLNTLGQGESIPDLVILDVMMPCRDGISTLREIRKKEPALPIIMLSGASSTVNIVEAMKSGANNFLTKPISHDMLRRAVDQFLPAASPMSKNQVAPCWPVDNDLGMGSWGRKFEPLLQRICVTDVPVLLQGETGCGKEVLARRIHDQSLRAGQPFLKLNCAALPSELVESELFGYERGAFTGAFKNNPGKFEMAEGGTILLDEIGDMDLKLQAKLLQVLQDHEFLRLGAKEPTRVDVRVIAASHRDLEARIEEGEFREDLYYRLNVISVEIPPLRERREEIIPLAALFLKKYNTSDDPLPQVGSELRAALVNYSWPGNIRELENMMRRYLVVNDARLIIEELKRRSQTCDRRAKIHRTESSVAMPACELEVEADSAASPLALPPAPDGSEPSELAKVEEARRRAETNVIVQALEATLWNRRRAAGLLRTDYKALLYKMKRLGIGGAGTRNGAAVIES